MTFWTTLRSVFGVKNKVAYSEMQYLIVGLGNIGRDYEHTRHNIGFDVLDVFAGDHPFVSERLAHVCSMRKKNKKFILVKPTTYMNNSGRATDYWMKKAKIPIENVLIIVDDLNLPHGSIRFRSKGSDGGHNGLKDIQSVLGRSDYARIRYGIGNDYSKGKQVDFVLGKWTDEEALRNTELINHCSKIIDTWMFQGSQKAMQLNKKI